MLACQFVALLLSVVKRFDAVVLHARESVREVLGATRGTRSGGEVDLS